MKKGSGVLERLFSHRLCPAPLPLGLACTAEYSGSWSAVLDVSVPEFLP